MNIRDEQNYFEGKLDRKLCGEYRLRMRIGLDLEGLRMKDRHLNFFI